MKSGREVFVVLGQSQSSWRPDCAVAAMLSRVPLPAVVELRFIYINVYQGDLGGFLSSGISFRAAMPGIEIPLDSSSCESPFSRVFFTDGRCGLAEASRD